MIEQRPRESVWRQGLNSYTHQLLIRAMPVRDRFERIPRYSYERREQQPLVRHRWKDVATEHRPVARKRVQGDRGWFEKRPHHRAEECFAHRDLGPYQRASRGVDRQNLIEPELARLGDFGAPLRAGVTPQQRATSHLAPIAKMGGQVQERRAIDLGGIAPIDIRRTTPKYPFESSTFEPAPVQLRE